MRAVLVVVLLAACHHGTRRPIGTTVPHNGNPDALARFNQAYSKFLEDGKDGAFKQIVEQYPNDPIVPWAELYAGIAAVKAHQFTDADAQLTKVLAVEVPADVATKASLWLGITKNYEGDTAAARKLLQRADTAIENDDERSEFLAAVAYARADGDQPLQSLSVFDQLWPRVTATERAAILARITEIVAAANPDLLRRAYDDLADRKGPSIAIVGSRLVLIMEEAGDAAGAAKRREDIAPVRAAVGLPRTIAAMTAGPAKAGAGDPNLIGAVMPGAAKDKLLSDAVGAGLGLAAGAPDGKGVAAIEARAAADKTEAAEVVDNLAHHNAIAIVGPVGDSATDAAAGRAEGLAIPLVSLTAHAEGRAIGRYVFHIRHSPEARARALAQRALGKGIKKWALLGPDTDYGRGATAAFADELAKGGGTVVVKVLYAKDATGFGKSVQQLASGWDGVFVADQAANLGLIAPTIAANGAVPKAVPFPKKVLGGRPVLLVSTADDANGELIVNAGHHLEGALLAPGFFPDDADPTIKPFVDRYVMAYGRAPAATAAYAFDAAQLIASAALAGGGRSGLATALASSQLVGVTGTIKFDSDHHRADPGVIYTVVEETGGAFAIRVSRP